MVEADIERILERANGEPACARQVGGTHYSSLSVQPWEAIASWMGVEQFRGFLRGNVVKYIARYPNKGGVEDLRKARHILDRLIELEESVAPPKP